MFGAGIYFALTEQAARHKAASDGAIGDAMVEADVDLGKCLNVTHSESTLNLVSVRGQGCDSVHGCIPGRGDEFVVFEPERVRIIKVKNV
jgi:hypothetical protein